MPAQYKLAVQTPLTINREELAWAAGLFDGEGTCVAYDRLNIRGCRQRGFTICVAQAGDHAPELLERFRRAVGGIGRVYLVHGPKRKSHYKQGYSWRISSFEGVQAIVALLWNWLSTHKKVQTSTALLEFLSWPRGNLMTSERGRQMAERRWSHA